MEELHARIAPRCARPEVRARARRYRDGLLGPVERQNGWQLAERSGEVAPDGVQRRLRTARGDAEAVRDDLRAYVAEHLGDPAGVLVVDETGFLTKGTKSAGVARQYSGTAGRIENRPIGGFLAYASPRGRAFRDRALYLPKERAMDAGRRREAGVPAAWAAGDEGYGNDGGLRRWLQAEGHPYVLAVARPRAVWHGGEQVRVEALLGAVPTEARARIEAAPGSKGPRAYDWARARLPYATAGGWAQWLLRRSLAEPEAVACYRAAGPEGTPLEELARVAGARWAIEEGFERAQGGAGPDQYEVRRWDGWHRHVTLCLLAHAYPGVTRAAANAADEGGTGGDPIPLTAPEVRRLLLAIAGPPEETGFRLHWSRWRRQRQQRARRGHYRRRLARPGRQVPL